MGSLTIADLVARRAADFPERIALRDDRGTSVSYAELWEQIRALARSLHELGICAGDRIAVLAPNRVEWSLWEHAAHAIAAIPVGFGIQWTPAHVTQLLEDCAPTVLVVPGVESLAGIDPTRLSLCRLICLLDPPNARAGQDARWMLHDELVSNRSGSTFVAKCRAEDPATIIYTSGSTGKPKGIMHTHARVLAAVDALVGLYPELDGARTSLSWMPMEHLFQRIFNLVSLAFGMTTEVLSNPRNLIAAARDLRPSYFAGVPFVYEQLLQAIERAPAEFEPWRRELRLMIVGAAPSSADVLQRFAALSYPTLQAYSTSECLIPIASNTLRDNRIGSVGRPFSSYAFRLSAEGEIRVKGPGVFAGYLGQEELAASLFDEEGYFKTGDFGYLDGDGYLFVTGRREDFLKTSTGRRISPFEVESAYKRSALIEHIIVAGHGQRHLVALVQLARERADAIASQLGLAHADPAQRCQDERMKAAVLDEMRNFETDLDPYKRVRSIALLSEPLRVETGELTSTLKLRREIILQRYQPLLDALFAQQPSGGGQHAA